jgi:hypothetical protein
MMTDTVTIPSPKHSTSEFLAYETECRDVLRPLLAGLLDQAEKAGWNRRTAASTLMFLAAQQVSSKHSPSSTANQDRPLSVEG